MSHLTPQQMMLFFQIGAAGLFVLLAVSSIAQQRKRKARLEEAWRGFADETGGTYSVEKRGIENLVWVGGPTVSWTIRGVPVTLTSYRQNRNAAGTRLRAPVQLSRPLQFHVITQSALARFATSPKLWNVILANAEQEAEKKAAGAGESGQSAREAIQQLRFMASEPIQTGDPLFDAAFLLKSDDPERVRDLLANSGVSYWMQELKKIEKGWTFALATADLNGGFGLTLELQGVETDPVTLRAARSLVEAAIGRLVDQGAIAGSGRTAA